MTLRLLTVLAAALLAASAAAAAPPLTRVGRDGYSVSLPRGWHFVDATYPSDHGTHVWYDPANPLRRLGVVVTACVGCAEQYVGVTGKRLERLLPGATASFRRLDRWRVRFLAYNTDPWNPYPDEGLIVVTHDGAQATGYVRADLWLPERDRALARAILAGFGARGP